MKTHSTTHAKHRVAQRFGAKKVAPAMECVRRSLDGGYCGYICDGTRGCKVYVVRLLGEYGLVVVGPDYGIVTIIKVGHLGAWVATHDGKRMVTPTVADTYFRIGVDQKIPVDDWSRYGQCKEDPTILDYINRAFAVQ